MCGVAVVSLKSLDMHTSRVHIVMHYVMRAKRAGCAMSCYDKYQVTMQHLGLKASLQ